MQTLKKYCIFIQQVISLVIKLYYYYTGYLKGLHQPNGPQTLMEHYDERVVCLLLISIRHHLSIHLQDAFSFLIFCLVLKIFFNALNYS